MIDMFVQEFLLLLEHVITLVILVSLIVFLPLKIFFGNKIQIVTIISQSMKLLLTKIIAPFFVFLGKALFNGISGLWSFIFTSKKLEGKKGAKFLTSKDTKRIINKKEKGLLVDGKERRISKDLSYTHLLLVSSTGGGKTSRYIIPNVLNFASDKEPASIVITDPSGEIFERTSGYLQQQGFTITVLNPSKPNESLGYNPLSKIETITDIGEIAHILVNSANPDPKDPFWNQGAESIIQIFIHCLKALNKPEFLNLHNVLYLLQNFGNRQLIDKFVSENATEAIFYQYKGFISGNQNTIGSFISTATTSLKMFSNTDICQIMSEDEINFENMRNQKTALFLIVPSEKMGYYSFFLNIFYTQFFQAMMKRLPDKNSLPVYALMDEFANIGTIPNFTTILTTIRKYRVSLSVVIQDISQLASNYGREEMITILGNTSSKLCYCGVSMQTAEYFENMIGKVHIEDKDKKSGHTTYREHNLIDAQQIRTMADKQALFLVSNEQPILLDNVIPFFKNKEFLKYSEIPSYRFQTKDKREITYISLTQGGV